MVSSGSIGMLILLVGAVTGRAGLHSNLKDIPLFLPDEEELAAFEAPGHETNRKPRSARPETVADNFKKLQLVQSELTKNASLYEEEIAEVFKRHHALVTGRAESPIHEANRKPRSARPETFADYFKKLQLVQSELTKNASVGEEEIAEVFKRHGLATGTMSADPNNNGTDTLNATSNRTETGNLNLTSKDVFKIKGSVTDTWSCEDFKINNTTPLTETYKTQGGTTGNRTFEAPNANGTSAEEVKKQVEVYFVNATETEVEAFKKKCSILGTPTSVAPDTKSTTLKASTPVTVITPFLSTTASTNQFSSGTWWGVSKRRNHGLHKALKGSSFLEEAFKGRSTILNSQMNRRKLK